MVACSDQFEPPASAQNYNRHTFTRWNLCVSPDLCAGYHSTQTRIDHTLFCVYCEFTTTQVHLLSFYVWLHCFFILYIPSCSTYPLPPEEKLRSCVRLNHIVIIITIIISQCTSVSSYRNVSRHIDCCSVVCAQLIDCYQSVLWLARAFVLLYSQPAAQQQM